MPTLNWIGKDKIINHHQEVPYKVLNTNMVFLKMEKPTLILILEISSLTATTLKLQNPYYPNTKAK